VRKKEWQEEEIHIEVPLPTVKRCGDLRCVDHKNLLSSLFMWEDTPESMTQQPCWTAKLLRAAINAELSKVDKDEADKTVW
jgi:hypothetical protein